jgi:hypothetical protein
MGDIKRAGSGGERPGGAELQKDGVAAAAVPRPCKVEKRAERAARAELVDPRLRNPTRDAQSARTDASGSLPWSHRDGAQDPDPDRDPDRDQGQSRGLGHGQMHSTRQGWSVSSKTGPQGRRRTDSPNSPEFSDLPYFPDFPDSPKLARDETCHKGRGPARKGGGSGRESSVSPRQLTESPVAADQHRQARAQSPVATEQLDGRHEWPPKRATRPCHQRRAPPGEREPRRGRKREHGRKQEQEQEQGRRQDRDLGQGRPTGPPDWAKPETRTQAQPDAGLQSRFLLSIIYGGLCICQLPGAGRCEGKRRAHFRVAGAKREREEEMRLRRERAQAQGQDRGRERETKRETEQGHQTFVCPNHIVNGCFRDACDYYHPSGLARVFQGRLASEVMVARTRNVR